jgi:type 1 glutamine amidotransferase
VLFTALSLGGSTAAAAPDTPSPTARILVFTKTAGFRHASIPAAVRAVRELATGTGEIAVDTTEDASVFSDAGLARYDAVVFLMTTGDVLDEGQQRAFERFVRAGHGFVGVHSAADTEYGWPWYGGLVGAHFRSHPQIQRARIDVRTKQHPSTAILPRRWQRTDEWYNFARNPRPEVRVLATIDETSYSPGPGAMGTDHPIAWSHRYQGGRAWYTAGGHTDESYSEPSFRRHLLGGIRYAVGFSPPRILTVTSRVRSRRLYVGVRYTSCRPCRGRLRVRLARGISQTSIIVRRGTGRVLGLRLPRGRWRFSVVLEDPVTGLTDTRTRLVRVR